MATDVPVLVVDDDDLLGEALVELLRAEGFQARAFTGAAELLANLPDVPCACVIADVIMPDIDGPELLRRLVNEKGGAWPVVLMTAHANVPMAVHLLKAGAADFIEKPISADTLIPIVRDCLDRSRSAAIEIAERQRIDLLIAQLTPRELQVFDAIVDGQTNKAIARDLKLSPRTIEIFRARLMDKLGVENLAQVVRLGLSAHPGRSAA